MRLEILQGSRIGVNFDFPIKTLISLAFHPTNKFRAKTTPSTIVIETGWPRVQFS